MKEITIDFETRSTTDLKSRSRHNYMADKNFEIILMAVKYDDDETNVITKPSKEYIKSLMDNAEMLGLTIIAQNAAFEINSIEAIGVDTNTNGKSSNWRDTMVMCQYHGIPYSLDAAGKYLGIKNQKLNTGKELIDLFTKPISEKVKQKLGLPADKIFWEPEDKPEEWARFCEYNKVDVDAAKEIYNVLPKIPDFVWDEWLINLNINRRGILVDREFCRIATNDLKSEANDCLVELTKLMNVPIVPRFPEKLIDEWLAHNREKYELDEKMLYTINNMTRDEVLDRIKDNTRVTNYTSRAQIKLFFYVQFGIRVDSLTKDTMAELLTKALPNDMRRIIELFLVVSKTSTAKYTRFQELMDDENKVYDILNFYGARTGRWSSWGVQIHNLKRIGLDNYNELRDLAKAEMLPMFYDGLSDIYSQLVRTAIIAPHGKRLVIADFAQIEARVLQWLAGDQNTLDVFRSGKDYYSYTAATMFNKKYEEIDKASEERRKGKVAALALGYGGAKGALDRSPAGKEMNESEKLSLVRLWRIANAKVVKLWDMLNAAFIKCFTSKNEVVLPVGECDTLTFRYQTLVGKPAVTIELPSGRILWYPDVKCRGKDYVFYGKSSDDQFAETYVNVYGGFLAENVTQAIARDCLQIFINKLTAKGLPVVFHVHDEVICEIPKYKNKEVEEAMLLTILDISREVIYKGLPVIAEPKASDIYDK